MPLGGFIHIFLNPIFQQGKIQRPYNFVEQSSLFTLNVGGARVFAVCGAIAVYVDQSVEVIGDNCGEGVGNATCIADSHP